MTSAEAVGYIGLGNMGAPMAKRLLDRPGGLVVFDTRPEAAEKLVAKGAKLASNPREVAENAGVVSITVLNDEQVREVINGDDGILAGAKPGTVVAVHSTISDTTATELGKLCRERNVDFVDAPVSGGAPGAKQGKLAVMVGGTESAFAKVREPFGYWAELVVHAGPVGAGTRMKLARNLLHFVSFNAAAESQRLAEAAGIDLVELGKVVRHTDAITGGAGAIMLRDTTTAIPEDDNWFPIFGHVRDLGEKDLALALGLGDRLGVDLPLATLALTALGPGLGVGQGANTTTEENT